MRLPTGRRPWSASLSASAILSDDLHGYPAGPLRRGNVPSSGSQSRSSTSIIPTNLPTVVIVRGLRDHMPDHWQTLLAERLQQQGRAVHIVPQIDQDKRLRSARVANLERVVSEIDGPIVLVAHSVGCLITVHWALQARREVLGALLAAPPDFDTPLPVGNSDPQTLANNG